LIRTAVLGAGLAGLSAADALAARGMPVTLLEKNHHAGGLSSTFSRGAFCFDFGPHRFHTMNAQLLGFVRELLGDDLLTLERRSRIRLLDRYFDYPLAMGNVLSSMPPLSGLAMMSGFVAEKARSLLRPREQKSFEGWVLSRFGRPLYDMYFSPYNKKLWGLEPSELSADWASQRITVPSLSGLVRETLFPSGKVRSLAGEFHYPRGGIGRIASSLEERTRASGGRILFGAAPESVNRNGNQWEIITRGERILADRLINTIPLNEFAALLGPLLPDGVHAAAEKLSFRSLVFLTVLLKGETEAKDHWIYTSEDRYMFNRLSLTRSFDPAMPSQAVFEFSCDRGDRIWNADKGELLENVLEGAQHLGLFSRNMVVDSVAVRQEHAYPVYRLGYRHEAGTVLDGMKSLGGIVSCGRQGLFRYNNMDHSIEMGQCAALEVLGEGSVEERFHWGEGTWADG
jgi:protoporphyrinogen oxidase